MLGGHQISQEISSNQDPREVCVEVATVPPKISSNQDPREVEVGWQPHSQRKVIAGRQPYFFRNFVAMFEAEARKFRQIIPAPWKTQEDRGKLRVVTNNQRKFVKSTPTPLEPRQSNGNMVPLPETLERRSSQLQSRVVTL